NNQLRMYVQSAALYPDRGFTDAIYGATSADEGASWAIDPVPTLPFGGLADYDYDRINAPSLLDFGPDGIRMYYTGRGPSGSNVHRILSAILVVDPQVLTVQIDVKPGTFPNSVNLGSNGVISVAILSTPT